MKEFFNNHPGALKAGIGVPADPCDELMELPHGTNNLSLYR